MITKLKNFKAVRIFINIFKEQEAKRSWNNWVCLVMQLAASYLVLFVIEIMARHSFSGAFDFLDNSTRVFFYNGLLIFLTTLPVFLFRKRRLLRFILFAAWLLLGLVNGVVLSSRVTPLTGPDFSNITEASAIIKKYFSSGQIVAFGILLAGLIFSAFVYAFRSPRYKGRMHYLINIAAIALCVFGFIGLTRYYINKGILSSYFGNITNAYEDYGFPYCFGVTLLDTGINEPNNYSSEMINGIAEKAREKVGETEADAEDLPNIIVVQLESFFDLTRVKDLDFSEDPLPNWHKLCKSYTDGLYTVPTFGAGTVNTEFETLTGMSMRFFGAGEYPYKAILKEEPCESAAYILKQFGYTAFALHDNEANFYSRKKVYKNLGFDYFVSGEYMLNQDDVNENGWMRDENLIEPMMECMDSTEGKDFLYTVSVQPHGSYPTEEVLEDPVIEVSGSGLSDEELCAWEYYANQVYEEDQFIADLIAAVEERGEPTIIMFYGDHLPSMDVTDSDLADGTTYDTNYLIWDNIGLKKKNRTLCSYQAFASLFKKLKIHEGSIFNFQQSNLNQTSVEYASQLQTLQYDLLYGEQYLPDAEECVPNADYRLGLYDPEIEDISSISSNIYQIVGSHFTQSCKVLINGEMAETIFVDSTQLLVINAEIKGGDTLQIGVQSNSSTHKILSKSSEFDIPIEEIEPLRRFIIEAPETESKETPAVVSDEN